MSAQGTSKRHDSPRSLRWLFSLGIVASSAVAVAAPQAPADAKLEVVIYKGVKAATSAIPSGCPALANPPFNAYNSYVEVDKKTLELVKGKSSTATFTGGALDATLVDVAPKPKLELVIKDAKGVQLLKGTYSLPKGAPLTPTIINSPDHGIVPCLKIQ